MRAKEFDKKFDSGQDITQYLDVKKAFRPQRKPKRVNVDFPIWMVESLDREAKHLGVPRQSLIKIIVAKHIEGKVR